MSDYDDTFADLTPAEIEEERSIRKFEAEEQERAGRRHERHHDIAAAEEARLLRVAEWNRQQALEQLERVRRKAREYHNSLVLSDDHGSDIDPGTGRP